MEWNVIDKLEKWYGKTKIHEASEAWKEFKNIKRNAGESIDDFLLRFDTVESFLPSPVLSCPSLPALDTFRNGHLTLTLGEDLVTCGGVDGGGSDTQTLGYWTSSCVKLDLDANAWVYHSTLNGHFRSSASVGILDGRKCILGGLYAPDKKSIECWTGVLNFPQCPNIGTSLEIKGSV